MHSAFIYAARIIKPAVAVAVLNFILFHCFQACAAPLQGRVYIDANRDGSFDKNEVGVSDVAVSDGVQIVLTTQTGEYSLEPSARSHGYVFVTVPAGYSAPRGYYRSFSPKQGAPDFPLESSPETSDAIFDFIHMSDLHITGPLGGGLVQQMLHELDRVRPRPRFLLVTGDLTSYGRTQHYFVRQALSGAGLPVHLVMGNHEVSDNHGSEWFEDTFGPSYHAFNYGRLHVIVLDDNRWLPAEGQPGRYKIDPIQEQWLRRDLELAPKGASIIFAHHRPMSIKVLNESGSWLKQVYAKYNVLADLNGHIHVNQSWRMDGTQVITTASAAAPWYNIVRGVPGFRVLHFSRGKLSSTFRAFRVGSSEPGQSSIGTMAPLQVISPLPGHVYPLQMTARVAFYDFNSDRARVRCSLDDKPWVTINRQPGREPGDEAARATQQWKQEFELQAGDHQMRVRVEVGGRTIVSQKVAFAARSRPELWKRDLGRPIKVWFAEEEGPGSRGEFAGRMLQGKGPLFVVTESGGLSCMDQTTGRTLWDKSIEKGQLFYQAMNSLIYGVSADRHRVIARSSHSGDIAWERELSGAIGLLVAEASSVWVTGSDADGLTHVLDASSGAVRWSKPISSFRGNFNAVALDAESAFVGDIEGRLFQVALSNGDTKPLFRKPSYGYFLRLFPAIDRIIWSDFSGQTALVDRARATPRWIFDARMGVNNPILLPGDRIGFSSVDGWFYALEQNSGLIAWKTPIGGSMPKGEILAGDKILVLEDQASMVLEAASGKVLARIGDQRLLPSSVQGAVDGNWIGVNGSVLFALRTMDLSEDQGQKSKGESGATAREERTNGQF